MTTLRHRFQWAVKLTWCKLVGCFRFIVDEFLDPEVSYSLTGICLGFWILFGHALSTANPSVRGLRLLTYSVHWLPWSVDYTWAAMLIIPAIMQIWHKSQMHILRRLKFAMIQAMVFAFIASLLWLDYPPSTGVVMYSMPAVVQVVVMRKLIVESHKPNPSHA